MDCRIKPLSSILALAFSVAIAGNSAAQRGCEPPMDLRIFRIDEQRHTLFIEGKRTDVQGLKPFKRVLMKAQQFVQKCKSAWGQGWGVGLVTEAKYAVDIEEAKEWEPAARAISNEIRDGTWAKNVLAGYSNETNEFSWYPFVNDKRVKGFLKLE